MLHDSSTNCSLLEDLPDVKERTLVFLRGKFGAVTTGKFLE